MTSASAGAPARRAVVRWGWRLFRREWRQQVQLLALVTIAVAGAVAAGIMVVNAASPASGQFGAARALTRVQLPAPADATAVIDAARRQFGDLEVIRHRTVPVAGTGRRVDLRAQDPEGALGHGMLRLLHGRRPIAPDEVALTDGAADLLDPDGTGTIDLGGDRTARVVGRVENPGDLRDEFALVAPDALADADALTILLRHDRRPAPPGGGTSRAAEGPTDGGVDFAVLTLGDDGATGVVVVIVMGTTVAMLLVALVAAAGFLVVGSRRQRQLGLLAALGATERHQRLVLLANGAIVGLVSAGGGTVLGLLVWFAAAPAVEQAARHRIDRLDVPWGVILQCVVLAVVASTAAAWWPARALARRPVMAALSRRPPRPTPIHRSAAASAGLVAAGVAGMFASGINGDDPRPLVLMGSLAAMVIGVVLAAPSAIRLAAAAASSLPLSPRLALRDLGRHQSRAAAALAAITLAVGLSMAVVVSASASEFGADEGNLSNRQLLVQPVEGDTPLADAPLDETAAAGLDAAAATIGDAVGVAAEDRVPLDVAVHAPTARPNERRPVTVARQTSPDSFRFVDLAYVATDELLAHLGLDLDLGSAADLPAGVDLLTTATGTVRLLDTDRRPADQPTTVVRHIELPSLTSAPHSLITPHAMTARGLVPARLGWLLEAARPLTADQRRAAVRAAADAGVTVELRSTQDDLAALRAGATGIAIALALVVVLMTVGLIRSESAADLRTLTATGASPSVRRAVTADTAAVLALLGVALGTVGAYVVVAAAYHATLDRLASPPLGQLAAVAVGTPVLAAVLGWLFAGREPPAFARAALD
jgi:putative ABC transport system permease protein